MSLSKSIPGRYFVQRETVTTDGLVKDTTCGVSMSDSIFAEYEAVCNGIEEPKSDSDLNFGFQIRASDLNRR